MEIMQQTAIRISDVQELLLWVLAGGLRTSWALVKAGPWLKPRPLLAARPLAAHATRNPRAGL